MSSYNEREITIRRKYLKLVIVGIVAASLTIPVGSIRFEANANTGTLTNVSATPSNDLVNSISSYVITFALGTAGVDVKSVEVTFPAGFDVTNAKMMNIDTIYSGFPTGTLSVSGQKLIWDHDVALRPACCLLIKMTIGGIINGNAPTNQITIATKDINGLIIDGPTLSAPFKLVKGLTSTVKMNSGEQITVNLKYTKKSIVLAVKNESNTPIAGIKFKVIDGNIKFVKARGWDREKVDASTVIIQAHNKPISLGQTIIIMLLADRIYLDLEWTAFDSAHHTISTGILGEQSKHAQEEQPKPQEKGLEGSAPRNPSKSEADRWQLIAELQNVSVFGKTVRTETLCVEKLNWAISWAGGVYAVGVHGVDNSFYEEVTSMPNNVIADHGGCFFVSSISADGSGAVWVYGDKNISVKKYLPEPMPELMAQMKMAKRGDVTMGGFPAGYSGYGEVGEGANAYYRPSYGTLGKLAYACFEEHHLPFKFIPLMKVSWDIKGEFNLIQIYRELDKNSMELVYETHEQKGEFFIYDKGCYYGYVDINSMSEFVLRLIPAIAD